MPTCLHYWLLYRACASPRLFTVYTVYLNTIIYCYIHYNSNVTKHFQLSESTSFMFSANLFQNKHLSANIYVLKYANVTSYIYRSLASCSNANFNCVVKIKAETTIRFDEVGLQEANRQWAYRLLHLSVYCKLRTKATDMDMYRTKQTISRTLWLHNFDMVREIWVCLLPINTF